MTNIIDSNKTVILVDDSAASGSTLIAAARWIKNRKAHKFKKLIIAIVLAFTSIFLTTGSPFQIASDLTETNGYLNHKNIGEAYAEDGDGGGMVAVEAMAAEMVEAMAAEMVEAMAAEMVEAMAAEMVEAMAAEMVEAMTAEMVEAMTAEMMVMEGILLISLALMT